jgi:hypothetical protein
LRIEAETERDAKRQEFSDKLAEMKVKKKKKI